MDSIEQNQEGIELLEEHTSSPLLSSSLTTVSCVNHSEGNSQNNCSSPLTNTSMAQWIPIVSLFLELLFSGFFLNWGGLISNSTKTLWGHRALILQKQVHGSFGYFTNYLSKWIHTFGNYPMKKKGSVIDRRMYHGSGWKAQWSKLIKDIAISNEKLY